MASTILPNIFRQEVQPTPEIQNSLAGQAAANVAARKSRILGDRQRMAQQMIPDPAQATASPQVTPVSQPQIQPTFTSQRQGIDPNTVIARRPGGMVTVPTNTVIRRQEPTAGEIAANADVAEQQARYVGAQQELMDQQANWVAKKAEVQEKLVGIEEQSQARRAEIEAQRNEAMQDGLTKIRNLSDDLRGREVKDFWADKSTAQKIVAAIAVGIGGAVQAVRGGSNASMDIINSAIENDLMKQKANLAKSFDDLSEQRTLLGETSKMYDSKVVAEEAARVGAYKAVANELDVMASKAQSDEMKGKILEMSEAVKLQAAQSEQAFQQTLRADVTQNLATKVIPARTITVGDVTGARGKQQGAVDYREMAGTKEMKKFVPEYGGFAYDETDARELRKQASDRASMKKLMGKLVRFRESYGQWDALNPQEKKYAKTLHNEVLMLKKNIDELGVLAGPDLDLLLTAVPNPNDLFSFNTDAYRAVLDGIKVREREDIRGRIQPAVNIPQKLQRGSTASTFKAGI